jgi:hypothetical protein
MLPLLLKVTSEPLAVEVEVGARPAPVRMVPAEMVAWMLSANDWVRSLVFGLGVVVLTVLVVVTVPLHARLTGAVRDVEHTAQAFEPANEAVAKAAAAAVVFSDMRG